MTRKAFLCGINKYPNPDDALEGCVNDVLCMRELLSVQYGFKGENIRTLFDRRATKDAILLRIRWLMQGAKPGDELVFQYSGHGSQVVDRSGDEVSDNLDEILCPYDFDEHWDDPLSDDVLGLEFTKTHVSGANLTVVLDSCHSGTATRDIRVSVSKSKEASALVGYRKARRIHAPLDVRLRADQSRTVKKRRFIDIEPQMKHLLLAACKDNQTSTDTSINGSACGAFTAMLLQALRSDGLKRSWAAIMTDVGVHLKPYDQTPQLEGPLGRVNGPPFTVAP